MLDLGCATRQNRLQASQHHTTACSLFLTSLLWEVTKEHDRFGPCPPETCRWVQTETKMVGECYNESKEGRHLPQTAWAETFPSLITGEIINLQYFNTHFNFSHFHLYKGRKTNIKQLKMIAIFMYFDQYEKTNLWIKLRLIVMWLQRNCWFLISV